MVANALQNQNGQFPLDTALSFQEFPNTNQVQCSCDDADLQAAAEPAAFRLAYTLVMRLFIWLRSPFS